MSEYLYEEFLDEDKRNIYHLVIGYWNREITKLIRNNGLDYEECFRYLHDRFNNGTLFYDGNPIFNLAIPSKKKAIRIIQLPPSEYEEFYSSWISEKHSDDNGVNFIFTRIGNSESKDNESFEGNEKVFAFTLTKDNRNKALTEIAEWLQSRN